VGGGGGGRGEWGGGVARGGGGGLAAGRGGGGMSGGEVRGGGREGGRGSQLEEIDRLKRLISQLLTLARAEAGDIALVPVEVDVRGLTAVLVDQLEPVAQAKKIDLRFDGTGDVAEAIVWGDHGWLERLVLNLLGNS